LVTAIIPTFQRPQFVRRAIRSVLDQDLARLEVLVVDDASGDDTADVVRSFSDPRVRYVCNPRNLGAGFNTAASVRLVTTPYFSCLGDDEILLPEFYSSAVTAMEQIPAALFAYAPVAVLGPNRKMVWRRPDYFPAGVHEPPAGFERMVELGFPTLTGVVFRTKMLASIGGFDLEAGYHWDFEIAARAAAGHPFVVTEKVGAIWNEDAESAVRRGNKHMLKGHRQIEHWCRKVETSYRLPPDLTRSTVATLRRRYGKSLYRAALDWAADGEIDDVAKAYAILVALDHPKRVPLGRVLSIARVAPALLRLYHLKRILSNSPLFAGKKARKARRKFGDFLVYEKIIQEFD
jgi:glycosyltransferase involved in cell wall biosynthesis